VILLNFSHPITDEQMEQIRQALDALHGPLEVRNVKCQFDVSEPFAQQVIMLADKVGLTSGEWQMCLIIVNLPALSTAAALLLAELHGRMGYYPPVIRLKQVDDSMPPRWELAEILNINSQRNEARKRR
jgi:hypothetical protein